MPFIGTKNQPADVVAQEAAKPAVAAEVDVARADPADGHADMLHRRIGTVDIFFAAFIQRLYPGRVQLLVGRNRLEILVCFEGARHRGQAGRSGSGHHGQSGRFDKVAAIHTAPAAVALTIGSHRVGF